MISFGLEGYSYLLTNWTFGCLLSTGPSLLEPARGIDAFFRTVLSADRTTTQEPRLTAKWIDYGALFIALAVLNASSDLYSSTTEFVLGSAAVGRFS